MHGKLRWIIFLALCAVVPLGWIAIREQPDEPVRPRRQERQSPAAASTTEVNQSAPRSGGNSTLTTPLASDPPSPLSAIQQALDRRQPDLAFAALDRLITAGQFRPEAFELAMRTANELPLAAYAIRLLDAIPADDPKFGRASRLAAAERCMADFRLFDAIDRLKLAKQQSPPQDLTADQLLARTYEALGLKLEARPHLFPLLQRGSINEGQLVALVDRTLPTLQTDVAEQAITRHPRDLRPQIVRAQAMATKQQWPAVLNTVRPMFEAHPKFLPAYVLEGYALLELDRMDELEQWGKRAIEGKEQHPDYWLIAGRWARRRGSPEMAASALARACQLDPDQREAHTHLSQVLDLLDDPTSAAACWERAEQLSRLRQQINLWFVNRQSGQAAAGVADALFRLGRYWESLAWLKLAEFARQQPVPDLAARQADVQAKLAGVTQRVAENAQPALRLNLGSAVDTLWTGASTTEAASAEALAAPQLIDVASATGLEFVLQPAPGSTQPGHWIWQSNGNGIAVTDIEPDGWPDLYITQAAGSPFGSDGDAPNQLMRNLAGQGWSDCTSSARVGDRRYGQGVTSGDYNEDGFADLVVANIGEVRLLRNNGDGTYSDVSEEVGLSGRSWATSVALADFDGDRIADLFIGNYCGTERPFKEPCYNAAAKADRACVPAIFPPERDRVYQGMPDGTWRDVTEQWLSSPTDGRALGVLVADLAPSPGLELFVANDMSANQFWLPVRQDDSFSLTDAAGVRGLAVDNRGREQACMGIAAADPDNDQDLDLVVTNFFNEANNFYEQTRGGRFADKAIEWGLAEPSLAMLGFGTQWTDVDLDGSLELFVANGHIDDYSAQSAAIPFRMRAQLFGVAGGRLQEWKPEQLGPFFQQARLARAVARLDWNRDGHVELAVGQIEQPIALLTYQPPGPHPEPNHWIAVELIAVESQRDAIGASVTLKLSDGTTRWSQLTAGDGFQCSNQRQLLFGLGPQATVESLTIRWPSGNEQTWNQTSFDRAYLAIEGRQELVER